MCILVIYHCALWQHFWLCYVLPVLIVFLQVALVGQEPVLFDRTVEKNITYGMSDIPMDAVMQATLKANAHDFITNLPKGYETSKYSIPIYVL